MSRIGKKPVTVPEGVKVTVSGKTVKVQGPKGKLSFDVRGPVRVSLAGDKESVVVSREGDGRVARSFHGMTRAMIANMVEGVTKGYERRMELYGTGYSANVEGKRFVVQCGFAHPVAKDIPAGLEVEVPVAAARGDNDPAKLVIRGCDRQLVGQFAADIRRVRPPEPYKGKGIRYDDEVVRRKAGKALATGSA